MPPPAIDYVPDAASVEGKPPSNQIDFQPDERDERAGWTPEPSGLTTPQGWPARTPTEIRLAQGMPVDEARKLSRFEFETERKAKMQASGEWEKQPRFVQRLNEPTPPAEQGFIPELPRVAAAIPGMAGTAVGFAGKGLSALAGQAFGTGDTLRDVGEAIRVGAPMPIEKAAAEIPGFGGAVARGGLGVLETMPKLALLAVFPGSIWVQTVAAGGIFGLDAQGNFSVKGAVIGAMLPGAGALAKKAVAAGLTKAMASGVMPVLKSVKAQNALEWTLEEIGQQSALNTVMLAGESPEILAAYQRDPKEARNMVQEMVGNNFAWAIFGGARHFLGKTPTATQVFIRKNAKKYGDLADKMITRQYMGGEGQQVIEEAIAKAKKSQRDFEFIGAPYSMDEAFNRGLVRDFTDLPPAAEPGSSWPAPPKPPFIPAAPTAEPIPAPVIEKGPDNALQVGSTAQNDVGQAPENRPGVVGQIRVGQEPPVPRPVERPEAVPPPAPVEPQAVVPPVAEVKPSKPRTLAPALFVNGEPVMGLGRHKDIFEANMRVIKDPDLKLSLVEAQANDAQHVFVDENGDVLSRAQGAERFKEITGKDVSDPKFGLQSEDLIAAGLHKPAPEPKLTPPPVAPPVVPPVVPVVAKPIGPKPRAMTVIEDELATAKRQLKQAQTQMQSAAASPKKKRSSAKEIENSLQPAVDRLTTELFEARSWRRLEAIRLRSIRRQMAGTREVGVFGNKKVIDALIKDGENLAAFAEAAKPPEKPSRAIVKVDTRQLNVGDKFMVGDEPIEVVKTVIDPMSNETVEITLKDGDTYGRRITGKPGGDIPEILWVKKFKEAPVKEGEWVEPEKPAVVPVTPKPKEPAPPAPPVAAPVAEVVSPVKPVVEAAPVAGLTPAESARYAELMDKAESNTATSKERSLFRKLSDKIQGVQESAKPEVVSGETKARRAKKGMLPEIKATFFSRLTRTVEETQQGKANGAQWKAIIRNSKLGANADEMGLVGVGDLEDGKTYTKQEVLDYLKANEVQVKDVTLREDVITSGDAGELIWVSQDGGRKTPALLTGESADAGETFKVKYNSGETEWVPLGSISRVEKETHFSQYTLPGAKEGSYREVLLTVPEAHIQQATAILNQRTKNWTKVSRPDGTYYFTDKEGKWLGEDVEAAIATEDQWLGGSSKGSPWHDGHPQYSSIENPIVRLRFNERTTADGKRMLFIEELQPPTKGEFSKMPALFQKNWREIGFKWALRHAAENGFDSVGWTTGEMQAARYDLRKAISDEGIKWSQNHDGTIQLYARSRDTGGGLINRAVKQSEVADYVGKDIERQIGESLKRGANQGEITGEGLAVGGIGLVKLYDVDFRNVVNSLPAVKKTGQKVGTGLIESEGGEPRYFDTAEQARIWAEKNMGDHKYSILHDSNGLKRLYDDFSKKVVTVPANQSVHSLTLTPAIRESVLGGQALAQLRDAMDQANPTGRGEVKLQSVESLRALLRSGEHGLQPEAVKLINAFLDSPMGKYLDGVRFRIADALEHGWQGSYLEGLVELARNSKPETGPHEFGHRMWELLPKEVRDQFEAMRVRAIDERLNKGDNSFWIDPLKDLKANPITGGEDFTTRRTESGAEYHRDIYHLASAEEFFTHALSKAFKEKVDSKGAGLITRMKDMVRELVAVLRKALGLNQSQDQMLRNIMAGRYEISPETGIASEQNRRKQRGAKASLPQEELPLSEKPAEPTPDADPLRLKEARQEFNKRQVYGVIWGADYEPVKLEVLVQNLRREFDSSQPVSVEGTRKAFDIFEQMVNPAKQQAYANKLADSVGQSGAAAAMRNELWDYAFKMLLLGDARLLEGMRLRSAEIETRDFGRAGAAVGASASGLDLRIAQEVLLGGAYKIVRQYTEEQLVAAGGQLGKGQEAFANIIRAINDLSSRITPKEWEDVIQTGKDSQGRTLEDIIKLGGPERGAAVDIVTETFPVDAKDALPPAKRATILETVYEAMSRDITGVSEKDFKARLYNTLLDQFTLSEEQARDIADKTWVRKTTILGEKTKRLLDAELRALDSQAEKTAENFIRRYGEAEWVKPSKENPIQRIIEEALTKWDVPFDEKIVDRWRKEFEDILVVNNLSRETAEMLSLAVWKERQKNWTNANMRAMRQASESKSLQSLIESIQNSPYLAQTDRDWRLKTAELWFNSNDVFGEQATAGAKLFDEQFKAAYMKAAERIANELMRQDEPRTINELVEAIRSGLLDPSKEWTGELASRNKFKPLKPEQFAEIAQLEQKLSDPNMNPYERVALVEKMLGVMRHAGDQTGHTMQAVSESFAASLLSGMQTMTLQVGQPAWHHLMSWAVNSVFQPKDFVTLTRAALESTKNFVPEFANAWMKDASAFEAESAGLWKNELKRQFEIAEREWKEGKYHKAIPRFAYSWQQYVIRTLRSFDQATMAVMREYSMALYGSMAMRQMGFTTKDIAPLVRLTTDTKDAAFQKYRDEGKGWVEARAMADWDAAVGLKMFFENKLGWKRGENVWRSAETDPHNVTGRKASGIKESDEGMLSRPVNMLMEIVTKTRRGGGAPSILTIMAVGFMNVPFRAARYYAGWSPYGILRWGINNYMQKNTAGAKRFRRFAGRTVGLKGGEELQTYWKQSYANDLNAKVRLREALAGTGLMLAFLAWQHSKSTADDDAEKRPFAMFATGAGPSNKTMRDAWMKRGYRQYSINVVVNGRVVAAIPTTRAGQIFAYPMGIAAALDDVAWKRKQNLALGRSIKDPVSTEILTGASTYYNIVGAQGIFQSAGHIAQLGQGSGGIGRAIGVTASGMGAALAIPGKSLLAGLTELIYGPIDRSSIEASMVASVPILNAAVNGQAINRFGDVIGDRTWYAKLTKLGAPIAIRVNDSPENRALYQMLLDKGAAPPDLRRSIVEDKYGPLTQAEWNRFSKLSGDTLKQTVLANLTDLAKESTPATAVRQFMVRAADAANAQAAATMKLEPVPSTTGSTVGLGVSAGGGGEASAGAGSSISLPQTPKMSSLGLPKVPGGVTGRGVGGAGAGYSGTTTTASAPTMRQGIARSGVRTGLRRSGIGGGMPRRLSLSGRRTATRRFTVGKLRARSGRIGRRVRLGGSRRTRRLSLKG
jgi:hypothetical protein